MESTSSSGNETLTMGMCMCHNNFQVTAYIKLIKYMKILTNPHTISRAVIPLHPEWIVLLLGSLGLGMLHGVIPDEHTWPITFSYSVGSATGRGGMLSGMFFASAFTLQRAIMAQLVYFALASYLAFDEGLNALVYVAVGIAMSLAGYLILSGKLPSWHPLARFLRTHAKTHYGEKGASRRVPTHWCVIHGFIAGFGVDTGLFTTFIYLVAVPAMPVAYLGFAPGAAFGLGTLIVLLAIGSLFGGVLQIAKKWGPERVQLFGTRAGARSLFYGRRRFIIAGVPFRTGLQDAIPLDFGNLIVLAFMIGVIIPVMIITWREVKASPTPNTLTLHS